MKIRKRYNKAGELSESELKEAYSLVRVKYKLMGIDLPEMKMDAVEQKILKRYEDLENKSTSHFIQPRKETTEYTPMTSESKRIADLRNQLFDTIEQLKEGKIDIEKAKTIADIGQVIVNSAKVEVDFIRAVNGKGSYFFPTGPKQIEANEKD